MALVVVVGLGLLIFTTIALTTPSTTIVRQGIVIAWSAALLAGGIYFYRLLSRLGVLARRVDEGSAELAEIRERFQKYFEIHQRLNDIIEFLPNATFVVDTERRVVAWNRAIEDMTGVRKADILGRGNFEYSLPVYGERRPILIDLAFLPDDELKLRYDFVRKTSYQESIKNRKKF